MDQTSLVNRDTDALNQVARVFRENGIAVSGIYLIRLTADSGYTDCVVRLITNRQLPNDQRNMIYERVQLRRDKKLPDLATVSRFDLVSADDSEASRVIDDARQYDSLPVVINDTMWKGMFIEYAIVAGVPQAASVVA